MLRKYSPASGSVSVAQRSNMRYDLTYSSFQMFSHNCTWLAAREAGRSISNDDRIIWGGTLPTQSTTRATSKYRLPEKFWKSFIPRDSPRVVRQSNVATSPTATANPYTTHHHPPV